MSIFTIIYEDMKELFEDNKATIYGSPLILWGAYVLGVIFATSCSFITIEQADVLGKISVYFLLGAYMILFILEIEIYIKDCLERKIQRENEMKRGRK